VRIGDWSASWVSHFLFFFLLSSNSYLSLSPDGTDSLVACLLRSCDDTWRYYIYLFPFVSSIFLISSGSPSCRSFLRPV
jgi:hypothetical protein